MNKTRVLITGVSGQLGSNLAFCWKNDWDILGIYAQHPVRLGGIQTRQADLLDKQQFKDIIDEFKPMVIVHAAALAHVDQCEENQSLAYRLNVEMTQIVAELASAKSIKMVFISTDGVYGGDRGQYLETDSTHAVNYYAQTKIDAEKIVLTDPQALVLRTSFYGFNVQPKNSLAHWVIHELKSQRRIKGFTDAWSSNIFTFDLARLLKAAVMKNLNGIYNCGCTDAISKYDFAIAIADMFGLDASLIEPASVTQMAFKAKRPCNLSLNVTKLTEALGVESITSQQSLQHFYKQFNNPSWKVFIQECSS